MKYIVIPANVTTTIIEDINNEDVEITVGENANVTYVFIFSGDGNTKKIAHLKANASLHWRTAILGGNNNQEIITYLKGEGATTDHQGIFLGKQRDRFVIHYWNEHRVPHTAGHINIRGVLFDSAYADFKGNIKIQQTGSDTNASLVEETILLGNQSRSDSVPQLKIATNDVRATHSSAITKIDDEQLFYLQSRGIALEDGKRLIVRGFLEEMTSAFPDDVQHNIHDIIEDRLISL